MAPPPTRRRILSPAEKQCFESRRIPQSYMGFGLPRELAVEILSQDAMGCPVASISSFDELGAVCGHVRANPVLSGEVLKTYILPHTPVHHAGRIGDLLGEREEGKCRGQSFRVANAPRLQAKLAARRRIQVIREEIRNLEATLSNSVATSRRRLARLLDADSDTILDVAAAEDMRVEELQARWELGLSVAEEAARVARRRAVLAAGFRSFAKQRGTAVSVVGEGRGAEDLEEEEEDEIHSEMLAVAPDLHHSVYGAEGNWDPCEDGKHAEPKELQRMRKTEVAVQQLICEIASETKNTNKGFFSKFSSVTSQRDLIEAEAEICRNKLRLSVLGRFNQVESSALNALRELDRKLDIVSTLPTFLGNQVSAEEEVLPMHEPFIPGLEHASDDEIDTAMSQFSQLTATY